MFAADCGVTGDPKAFVLVGSINIEAAAVATETPVLFKMSRRDDDCGVDFDDIHS